MILAEQLNTLTSFTAPALSRAIQLAGYRGDTFTTAKFLGMTNGNQFCYAVTFPEGGYVENTKVFLSYNPTTGTVDATY
jgi:hypothetical protein